jgi:hypothetical protein
MDGVVTMAGTSGWAREWAQGGSLDIAKPSAGFVAALDSAAGPGRRCAGLDDDQVTGVLAGWARAEAWATSGKLATVTEMVRRRGIGTGTRGTQVPSAWDDTITEEVRCALGMSRQATAKMIDLAVALATRLDATAAALDAGQVDYIKAKIVADATGPLDDVAAGNAEKLALMWAGGSFAGKTPGEIGKLIDRAVIAADPDGAEKRRQAAEQCARVETWRESTGTMAIMGVGLNPQAAMEAEQAITAQAKEYKKAGVPGGMDSLRARAMLDRLTGRGTLGQEAPQGLAASVNLVVTALDLPLLTLLGVTDKPGEAAGWGAIDPALARDLATAAAAAGDRSDWHLTVTDEHGWAISHGCASRSRRTNPGKDWTFTTIPVLSCDHRYETSRHDPSPLLRHLVEVRDGACTHPGCQRPATRADFEHTVPWEDGGRTCGCNGNAKCRRDHQIKQHKDWTVTQPAPGFNQWRVPSGRTYLQGPKEYHA